MEWVLLLGHAVVGGLLLAFAPAPARLRRRAIETAAAGGFVLGAALVAAGAAGADGWRTASFEPAAAAPAGAAAAAAWVLVGAVGAQRGRVGDAALTGVAASGLALAAAGRWVVPALIFWLCSSAALAAGTRSRHVWALVAVSDAGVFAAAALQVFREDSWAAVPAVGDAAMWVLALAAIARAGACLQVLGGRYASSAPLLAGGAVVLAAGAGRADPWVALVVLGAAVAAIGRGLLQEVTSPRLLGSWPVAVALAVCFVSPRHAGVAGVAAVLAVAAAALWPFSSGRGGFERALFVSAVPLTAGFGMIGAGAASSFEQATAGGAASLAWAMVAALLPAAFAGGVVVGSRAARDDVEELVPEAVLATWLLLAGSVFVALAPAVLGGPATRLGESGGVTALHLVALSGGVGAALAARRWDVPVEPRAAAAGPLVRSQDPPALPSQATWATLGLAAAVVLAAVWLTVAGLRVGFL